MGIVSWLRRNARHTPHPTAPKDRPFPTRDGTWVRSFGEQRIADFLSRRGVPYEYEPRIEGKRPDFRVKGTPVLIEYWGGAGHRRYETRMVEKVRLFEEAGYDVVSLVPVNLWEIERVLDEELRGRGLL